MSISKKKRSVSPLPSNRCFSHEVVNLQKILYCVGSIDCKLCGDRRLMINDRIIAGDYSDGDID
jgi:hypothetical protein